MRGSRALAAVAIAAPALLAAAACDPCAGTASCRGAERVSYTGRVVEHSSGRGTAGVAIMFVRGGGVSLAGDTIRATTDESGFFHLSADAMSAGQVTGSLHVAPPGRASYDVPDVVMRTTRVTGDGGDLGRLVADPYIEFIAEVRNRAAGPSVSVPDATITFRRTGGVEIVPEVLVARTDAAGRFFFGPAVKGPGTVEGTITFDAPTLSRVFTRTLTIETRYFDTPTRDVHVLNVGFGLLWAGEIFRRATNEHVPGIRVDFQRTSGIDIQPSQFTSTTNEIGLFPLQPTPLGEGSVVGRIVVHPPPPYPPFTVQNVRFQTMDDDVVRLAGRWGYGTQAFGAIELRSRTTREPVPQGTVVVFRRTGGVAATPTTYTDQVNQFGFAKVELPTDAAGEVVGDFEVRLGEPYGTEVITGKRLPSADDDSLHFYGTQFVGRWFPQVGQLLDSATQRPIAGARVVFTRVDGIRFSPDPYVTTPNADGFFALRPQPLEDGDVVGNLTFELPAPYTSTTVRGLHLRSSMDDTLRFVGAFLFGKPR